MVIAEPTRGLDILEEDIQPALTALIEDELQPDLSASARDLVALLFAAAVPLDLGEVQRLLDLTPRLMERVLERLAEEPPLGLRVQRFEDRLQLTTAPAAAPTIERFLGAPPPVRLSRAALEALAVVAYRQPVTRGDIDAVRGVNSDSAVTTLLSRNLVVEVGRRDTVGRPALLAVTSECLQYLGISSLAELPPLPDHSLPTAVSQPAAATQPEDALEPVAPNGAVHDGLEASDSTEVREDAIAEPHEASAQGLDASAEARGVTPGEPEAIAEPLEGSAEAREVSPGERELVGERREGSAEAREASPAEREVGPEVDVWVEGREVSREVGRT